MRTPCNPGSSSLSWPLTLTALAMCLFLHASLAVAQDKPTEPSGADADTALATKINAYVVCINDHSNDVHRSRARYLAWIKDPKRGPTGREQVVYGLYTLDDPAECRAGIAQAESLPPSDPKIEQAAAAWIDALMALQPMVAEANTYYDLENYKDDDMRKGKALHPQLMQAFDRFDAANDALYAQIVAAKDELDQRRLQRLAADPAHKVEYLLAAMSDSAKRILRLAQTAGSKDFNPDAYSAAVSAYEKAYFAVEAYHKQHPEDEREMLDSPVMGPALNLLKSAKALMRRERDGFRFNTGERMLIDAGSAEMVDGHPKQVIENYNDFIDAENTWGNI